MTTTAAEPGIENHPDIQGLDDQGQNGQQASTTPRKRGRPKGSRNRTPRATASAPEPAKNDGPPEARAVIVEDGTLTIVTDRGFLTFAVEPQFVLDRRK